MLTKNHQHLQRGAKWFLKGINSPFLGFDWHPFEGPGIQNVSNLCCSIARKNNSFWMSYDGAFNHLGFPKHFIDFASCHIRFCSVCQPKNAISCKSKGLLLILPPFAKLMVQWNMWNLFCCRPSNLKSIWNTRVTPTSSWPSSGHSYKRRMSLFSLKCCTTVLIYKHFPFISKAIWFIQIIHVWYIYQHLQ